MTDPDPLNITYFVSPPYNYRDKSPRTEDEFKLRCRHQLDELSKLLYLIHYQEAIRLDQYRLQLRKRPCLQLSEESIWRSFISVSYARRIAGTLQLIFQGTIPLDYPDWITVYPEFLRPVTNEGESLTFTPPESVVTTNPMTQAEPSPRPNIELTVQKCHTRGLQQRPVLSRQAMI
jgi:hypothetical protein